MFDSSAGDVRPPDGLVAVAFRLLRRRGRKLSFAPEAAARLEAEIASRASAPLAQIDAELRALLKLAVVLEERYQGRELAALLLDVIRRSPLALSALARREEAGRAHGARLKRFSGSKVEAPSLNAPRPLRGTKLADLVAPGALDFDRRRARR